MYSLPPLITFYQFGKVGGLFCFANNRMFEQVRCRWPLLRLTPQTQFHKFLERSTEIAFQSRWRVFGYEKKDFHGVYIRVWRLALRKLQCGNAQRPDVCFVIIARLLDDFGSHPERCPDERVFLGHGSRELSRNAEVGQLHLPVGAQ